MALPGRSLCLELSHEEYMRLSALHRKTGKSRQQIVREWIQPHLDGMPAAEFDGGEAAVDEDDG